MKTCYLRSITRYVFVSEFLILHFECHLCATPLDFLLSETSMSVHKAKI